LGGNWDLTDCSIGCFGLAGCSIDLDGNLDLIDCSIDLDESFSVDFERCYCHY
jgi:hypothetical protein